MHGLQDGDAGESAPAEQPAPEHGKGLGKSKLDIALASTMVKGKSGHSGEAKGKSGKLQPCADGAWPSADGLGPCADAEDKGKGESGKLAGADCQMQPDIAELQPGIAQLQPGIGQLQPCADGAGPSADGPGPCADAEDKGKGESGKLAGADCQMQPDIAELQPGIAQLQPGIGQLQPCAEIHEVCADHPKKSTTDVTLQNNACNYPGGEVVNSVPELHHQHKEPHHVGMDDSMVQVEREPCADDVGNPGIGVRVGSESTLTPTLVIPGPGPVTCEADACGNHDATTPRPGLPTTPSASGTPVSRPRARDDCRWQSPSRQLMKALDLSQTVPACMTPQAPSESGMSMASDLSTLSACDLRTAVEAVNGFAMAAQTSPKARRD